MLDEMAFANAATVVTAVFYILFIVFSYIAPDFIYSVAKSWLHSINLESAKAKTLIPLDKAIVGLVTISALTWVTTYAMIWLYNAWAQVI